MVRLLRRRRASRSGDRRDRRGQPDLLGARLLAGRELPGHRQSRAARHRRVRRCSRRRRAGSGRCSTSDLDDVLAARPPQRRRQLPRRSPRARCRAGRSAGSATTARAPTIPNDVVPHEHRRELRALKVFGAWTNLVDMKAGNTLDTVVDRERPQRRSPLPAGCRLDVRHRRQRAARVRRGLGVSLRRRADAEAAD